jgi:bacteriorhodopsin
MSDQASYASKAPHTPHRWAFPAIGIAGVTIFLAQCVGTYEALRQKGDGISPFLVLFIAMSLLPSAASFFGLRTGSKWTLRAAIALSGIFCLLYLLAAASAYALTGLNYLPAVAYPSVLSLAFAMNAVASLKPKPLRRPA